MTISGQSRLGLTRREANAWAVHFQCLESQPTGFSRWLLVQGRVGFATQPDLAAFEATGNWRRACTTFTTSMRAAATRYKSM